MYPRARMCALHSILLIGLSAWQILHFVSGSSHRSAREVIVVAGNFSLDGKVVNIAQYDIITDTWSDTSQADLFLYGQSNGVIWDVVANETTSGYDRLYVVGAFDTSSETSQIQYCSVGAFDGTEFEKVGEGLCPRGGASSATMQLQAVVVGKNGDLFVGGSFQSRVWDGHRFADVRHIARFEVATSSWLPLTEGSLRCTDEETPKVTSLAWDDASDTLFVGGLFHAVGDAPITSGLAIWTRHKGLSSFPGGGLSLTEDSGHYASVKKITFESQSGSLFVSGTFANVNGHPCKSIAVWHRASNSWKCLQDVAYEISTVTTMLVTHKYLFLAGWAAAGSSWQGRDWQHPYTIARLDMSSYLEDVLNPAVSTLDWEDDAVDPNWSFSEHLSDSGGTDDHGYHDSKTDDMMKASNPDTAWQSFDPLAGGSDDSGREDMLERSKGAGDIHRRKLTTAAVSSYKHVITSPVIPAHDRRTATNSSISETTAGAETNSTVQQHRHRNSRNRRNSSGDNTDDHYPGLRRLAGAEEARSWELSAAKHPFQPAQRRIRSLLLGSDASTFITSGRSTTSGDDNGSLEDDRSTAHSLNATSKKSLAKNKYLADDDDAATAKDDDNDDDGYKNHYSDKKKHPSEHRTFSPSHAPSRSPSQHPTRRPTQAPTRRPVWQPRWEWLPGFPGGDGPILRLTQGSGVWEHYMFIAGAFNNLPGVVTWTEIDASAPARFRSAPKDMMSHPLSQGRGLLGDSISISSRSRASIEAAMHNMALARSSMYSRRLDGAPEEVATLIGNTSSLPGSHLISGLVTSVVQTVLISDVDPLVASDDDADDADDDNSGRDSVKVIGLHDYIFLVFVACIGVGILLGILLALSCIEKFSREARERQLAALTLSATGRRDDRREDVESPQVMSIPLTTLSGATGAATINFRECFVRAMQARHLPTHEALLIINPKEINLSRIIGEGSFGRVWSGHWRNNAVAVKEFVFAQAAIVGGSLQRNSIVEEIVGEAGVMSCLRHPKILQLYGCSLTMQAIWIVSELCIRGSLRMLLTREHYVLPIMKRLSICLDVADGMQYLHSREPPIIHRDLKSHNIFISEPFPGHLVAKIGDWGSARAVALSAGGSRSMTQGVGTACWLSPEVINHAHFSKLSDVYAFGIVLWEVYTREELYDGLNATQIIAKVAHEGLRPTLPPDCPWAEIMTSCWDQLPSNRPSFDNILADLNRLYSNVGGTRGRWQGQGVRTTGAPAPGAVPSTSTTASAHASTSAIGTQGANTGYGSITAADNYGISVSANDDDGADESTPLTTHHAPPKTKTKTNDHRQAANVVFSSNPSQQLAYGAIKGSKPSVLTDTKGASRARNTGGTAAPRKAFSGNDALPGSNQKVGADIGADIGADADAPLNFDVSDLTGPCFYVVDGSDNDPLFDVSNSNAPADKSTAATGRPGQSITGSSIDSGGIVSGPIEYLFEDHRQQDRSQQQQEYKVPGESDDTAYEGDKLLNSSGERRPPPGAKGRGTGKRFTK